MAEVNRETALRDWLERRKAMPRLLLGFCIRNLNVHGFDASTRVQATALSFLLDIPRLLPRLLSHRQSREVQILSGINGAVNSGEMLLVLGRPGSGCTTFLKALAGDTHGITVSSLSAVNYEGMSVSNTSHLHLKSWKNYPSWLQPLPFSGPCARETAKHVPHKPAVLSLKLCRNIVRPDASSVQRREYIPRRA